MYMVMYINENKERIAYKNKKDCILVLRSLTSVNFTYMCTSGIFKLNSTGS